MNHQQVCFLLVEDNVDHAELVMRGLRKSHDVERIEHVEDGEQAIAFLSKQDQFADCPTPDLILLDLKLPKIDGLEVLATIKQHPRWQRIPVVIMTTSDAEQDRARAYHHHANSYLVKPLDFDQFRRMVLEVGVYWGGWNRRPACLSAI